MRTSRCALISQSAAVAVKYLVFCYFNSSRLEHTFIIIVEYKQYYTHIDDLILFVIAEAQRLNVQLNSILIIGK